MKPLYIFDLDGTLALIDHRRHFVTAPEKIQCDACDGDGKIDRASGLHICSKCNGSGKVKDGNFKPNWDAFHQACVNDIPNWPVINTLNALYKAGAEIWFFSGRSAVVYDETLDWLAAHVDMSRLSIIEGLNMRAEGDYTPDEQLKEKWLKEMSIYFTGKLVAVFDDRQKVVDMWRRNGVTCFQVAEGDF